jgi:sugar phosphate permease
MRSFDEGDVRLYGLLIFGIMALAYFQAFFHRVCPAVVALDVQRDFGISASLTGVLASAYFYGYAAIQFPGGLLCDSLGPRKAVTLFLIVGGIGSLLFGLSTGVETAVVGRVMVGLGAGMVFTPTMKLVSEWFRLHQFARMNAALLATGGLGALSAAAPLAFFTQWVGWRMAFEVIGITTFALAVVTWIIVRDRPADKGWRSPAELERAALGKALTPPAIGLMSGVRQVVSSGYFWLVALWSFCTMGAFFAFGGLWAGPYLMHMYGMTRGEAGSVLNMPALGIMIGSPIMGVLSEKIFLSRKWVLVMASSTLIIALGILRFFPAGLPVPALYVIFFLFAACAIAPGVVSVTTAKELFPPAITGTSVGTLNQFPFIGAALLQVFVGWTLDSYPGSPETGYSLEAYSVMLSILLVCIVVGWVSALFMKETFPRGRG